MAENICVTITPPSNIERVVEVPACEGTTADISQANFVKGGSGYSGYSGDSGYSGYSGIGGSGYSGYSGSGISGYSGYSGSGVSGYSGYPGPWATPGTRAFPVPHGQRGF